MWHLEAFMIKLSTINLIQDNVDSKIWDQYCQQFTVENNKKSNSKKKVPVTQTGCVSIIVHNKIGFLIKAMVYRLEADSGTEWTH